MPLSLVALFTRAWIEMSVYRTCHSGRRVALFTRAWIEIHADFILLIEPCVALFTRAWIEILTYPATFSAVVGGRPLHEGVD